MKIFVSFRPAWLLLWVIANFDVSVVSGQARSTPLLEIFSWKKLDWDLTNQEYVNDLDRGQFQPENGIPLATALWRDKLFIAVPRWLPGIPATLNYVPINWRVPKSPKLIPYPNMAYNNDESCETGIVTVSRIHVDKCNRLWAFDTGNRATRTGSIWNKCSAALKIFDLTSDRLVRSRRIRSTGQPQAIFITNIAVDVRKGDCNDAYAYITDERVDSIFVYDWRNDDSWRIPIDWISGVITQPSSQVVFGIALSHMPERDEQRKLYFHPYNGHEQFHIRTNNLKSWNRARPASSINAFLRTRNNNFRERSSIQVIDGDDNIMYYNLIDDRSIGCQRLDSSNAIHARIFDAGAMHNPDHIMIDDGYMWITSHSFSNDEASRNNYAHDNFRILLLPLKQAFAGTECDPDVSLSVYSAYENSRRQYENRPLYPSEVFPSWSKSIPNWGNRFYRLVFGGFS